MTWLRTQTLATLNPQLNPAPAWCVRTCACSPLSHSKSGKFSMDLLQAERAPKEGSHSPVEGECRSPSRDGTPETPEGSVCGDPDLLQRTFSPSRSYSTSSLAAAAAHGSSRRVSNDVDHLAAGGASGAPTPSAPLSRTSSLGVVGAGCLSPSPPSQSPPLPEG